MRWKGHGICVLAVGPIRSTVQNLSTTTLSSFEQVRQCQMSTVSLWNSIGAGDVFVIWFLEEKTAVRVIVLNVVLCKEKFRIQKNKWANITKTRSSLHWLLGFGHVGELRFLDLSAHCAVSILGWMNLDIIGGHYVDLAADGVQRVIVRSVTLHTPAHCQNYD